MRVGYAGRKRAPSVPDIGQGTKPSGSAPPEPLKRFLIEIPQALIDKLALVHFEIGHHERDDILALLSALARAGRQTGNFENQ